MEKVDLELEIISSMLRKFVSDNHEYVENILVNFENVFHELKSLRSENEKLRKVAEAAEQYINDKYLGTGIIEDALKEWKGDK